MWLEFKQIPAPVFRRDSEAKSKDSKTTQTLSATTEFILMLIQTKIIIGLETQPDSGGTNLPTVCDAEAG